MAKQLKTMQTLASLQQQVKPESDSRSEAEWAIVENYQAPRGARDIPGDFRSAGVETHGTRTATALSPAIFNGLVAVSDVAIVIATGIGAYTLYPGWRAAHDLPYILAITVTALLTIQAFSLAGLYSFDVITNAQRQFEKLVRACLGIFLVILACTFFLKISGSLSRVWMASWTTSSVILLILSRGWICHKVHMQARAGKLTRNIAIVGSGGQARKLLRQIRQNPMPWNRVIGVFDDRVQRSGSNVTGYPLAGTLEDLVAHVRKHRVDDVLIALPWNADARIMHILRTLKTLPVQVALCPDLVGLEFPEGKYQRYLGVPVLSVFEKPTSGWKHLAKNIFDRTASAGALLVTSPLLLAIGVLVKLTSAGPVFFVQNRYGFNNELIKVLKFRTMYQESQDTNAEQLVVRGDPRVTPLGAFLRRTSLDELPQLFNVLKGEMSLVGPRPHAVSAKAGGMLYEEAVSDYLVRHKMKPGITGWAQVNGWRGETDTVLKITKRVEFDLYYVENWSLALDFWIILRTLWSGFRSHNAY